MKILTVWQGVAVVLTLGATVSAYLEHQKRDQRVQNDLVEGRLGVAIEIRNGQANTVAVRQFVHKRKDGNILVINSLYPDEEGVRGCDRQRLNRDLADLQQQIDRNLQTLSGVTRLNLQSSFALVVAGRVVCGFENFKNLKDLHAYGMRYKLTKPEMSQPGSP